MGDSSVVTGYQRESDVRMSLAMDAVKGSEVKSDSFVIPPRCNVLQNRGENTDSGDSIPYLQVNPYTVSLFARCEFSDRGACDACAFGVDVRTVHSTRPRGV